MFFFFFKQKTAYEMRISDWSSDVCSSDLLADAAPPPIARVTEAGCASTLAFELSDGDERIVVNCGGAALTGATIPADLARGLRTTAAHSTLTIADSNSTAILPSGALGRGVTERSEEHTSEPPSLMRISSAVFCLKKKNKHIIHLST